MLSDRTILDTAARAAIRAQGRVEPNPMVGAVLVSADRRVIGIGHHRSFGGPHAETNALADARSRGEDPHGATIYVTLEPCNAAGKNPACVDALIKANIAEVVYAREDPSPNKAGGAARLRKAGIPARLCGESKLAFGLAAPFVKAITTGAPWVIAKWAQTIDGRIATRSGESKWISNEQSRRRVHRLRARVDAILTGIGTIIADNPMLNARGVSLRRVAKRVIADSDLDVSLDAQVVKTAREVPTIIACDNDLATSRIMAHKRASLEAAGVTLLGVPTAPNGRGLDLRALLSDLHNKHAVTTVMLESGPGLLGSMFDEDLIDEAIVYIAPLILGDELAKSVAVGRLAESLSAARRYQLWRMKNIESDVELTYRRREHI